MGKICDHKSVGMLVWQSEKLLLIERRKFPFGFAPPAGHLDDDTDFEVAAKRELEEEVGLTTKSIKLVAEGKKENPCRREGGTWHYWKIYEIQAEGEVKRSLDETKQAGWYNKEEIKKLLKTDPGIEPVWVEWFKELNII